MKTAADFLVERRPELEEHIFNMKWRTWEVAEVMEEYTRDLRKELDNAKEEIARCHKAMYHAK
jgi:hypothetical protein